jgi:nucleoside-diphosphate-sugar epimerase
MKIALIGATGFVGAKVLAEALARGHTVTGIVLHPEKLSFSVEEGSIFAFLEQTPVSLLNADMIHRNLCWKGFRVDYWLSRSQNHGVHAPRALRLLAA